MLLLVVLRIFWISSLLVIGLLVGNFYGLIMGVILVGLIFVVLFIGMDVDKIDWFVSVVGGIVGSLVVEKMWLCEE